MPKFSDEMILPFSPQQMYALVADVASYDQFLPWVVGTRLFNKKENQFDADLIVGFKMFKERFTSRVNLTPNEKVYVDYIKGPMKYLYNDWRFEPHGESGSKVYFTVDFEFKSMIFQKVAGLFFEEATQKMMQAFIDRAKVVYGSQALGQ